MWLIKTFAFTSVLLFLQLHNSISKEKKGVNLLAFITEWWARGNKPSEQ